MANTSRKRKFLTINVNSDVANNIVIEECDSPTTKSIIANNSTLRTFLSLSNENQLYDTDTTDDEAKTPPPYRLEDYSFEPETESTTDDNLTHEDNEEATENNSTELESLPPLPPSPTSPKPENSPARRSPSPSSD